MNAIKNMLSNSMLGKGTKLGALLGAMAVCMTFAGTALADPHGTECSIISRHVADKYGITYGATYTLMSIPDAVNAYLAARDAKGFTTDQAKIDAVTANLNDFDDVDQFTRPEGTLSRGDRVSGNADGSICAYILQASDANYLTSTILYSENIVGKNALNDDNYGQSK